MTETQEMIDRLRNRWWGIKPAPQEDLDIAERLERLTAEISGLEKEVTEWKVRAEKFYRALENSELRAALDPGKCPCDCCELDEYNGKQYWRPDCQCGNQDDAGEARSWCDDANKFAAVSGKRAPDIAKHLLDNQFELDAASSKALYENIDELYYDTADSTRAGEETAEALDKLAKLDADLIGDPPVQTGQKT